MYIEGIEWGLPAVDSQRKTGQLQAIESARDETRRWLRSPGELASFIEQVGQHRRQLKDDIHDNEKDGRVYCVGIALSIESHLAVRAAEP